MDARQLRACKPTPTPKIQRVLGISLALIFCTLCAPASVQAQTICDYGVVRETSLPCCWAQFTAYCSDTPPVSQWYMSRTRTSRLDRARRLESGQPCRIKTDTSTIFFLPPDLFVSLNRLTWRWLSMPPQQFRAQNGPGEFCRSWLILCPT
jgi:hypothetical protein